MPVLTKVSSQVFEQRNLPKKEVSMISVICSVKKASLNMIIDSCCKITKGYSRLLIFCIVLLCQHQLTRAEDNSKRNICLMLEVQNILFHTNAHVRPRTISITFTSLSSLLPCHPSRLLRRCEQRTMQLVCNV